MARMIRLIASGFLAPSWIAPWSVGCQQQPWWLSDDTGFTENRIPQNLDGYIRINWWLKHGKINILIMKTAWMVIICPIQSTVFFMLYPIESPWPRKNRDPARLSRKNASQSLVPINLSQIDPMFCNSNTIILVHCNPHFRTPRHSFPPLWVLIYSFISNWNNLTTTKILISRLVIPSRFSSFLRWEVWSVHARQVGGRDGSAAAARGQ